MYYRIKAWLYIAKGRPLSARTLAAVILQMMMIFSLCPTMILIPICTGGLKLLCYNYYEDDKEILLGDMEVTDGIINAAQSLLSVQFQLSKTP